MATDSQSSYSIDTLRTKEDPNVPPTQRTKTSLEDYDQSFQRFASKTENFLKAFQEFRKASVELDSEIKRAYGLEGKLSGVLSKYNDVKDAINTAECNKAIQSLTTSLESSRKEHAKYQSSFQSRIEKLSNDELSSEDEAKQVLLDDWQVFFEQRFDTMDSLVLSVLEYKLCMQRPPAYSADTLIELVTRGKACLLKPTTLTAHDLQVIKKNILEDANTVSPLKTLLKDEIFSIYFRMFLRKEHMEENMMFLHDAERFLEIQDPQKRIKKALEIYDTYFHSESKRELNLEGPSKQKITEVVENFRSGNGGVLSGGSSNIFGEAVTEVLTRLETDHFKRFVQSDFWVRLLRRLEKKKLQETLTIPTGASTDTAAVSLVPSGYNSNSLSPKQARHMSTQYKRKSNSLVKSDLAALEQIAAEDPSIPKVDRRKTIQVNHDMSRNNSFNLRDFARRLNTMREKDSGPEFAPSDAPLNPLGKKIPTPNSSTTTLGTMHSESNTSTTVTSSGTSTSVSREVSVDSISSSKSSQQQPKRTQVEITESLEDLVNLAEHERPHGFGKPLDSPNTKRLSVSRSAENIRKAIRDESSNKNLKVSFNKAPKEPRKSKKEQQKKKEEEDEEQKPKKLDVRSRSRSYFVPRAFTDPPKKTGSKLDLFMPWKKKSQPTEEPTQVRNPLMLLSSLKKQEKEFISKENTTSNNNNNNITTETGLNSASSLERKSSKSSWGSKDSKNEKKKKKDKKKKKKSKKAKKQKEPDSKYPPPGSSKLHLNPLFQSLEKQETEANDDEANTRDKRSNSLDSGMLKKSASTSAVMKNEKEREIEAWLLAGPNVGTHPVKKSSSHDTKQPSASTSAILDTELEELKKRAEERRKKREMELKQAEEEAKLAAQNRNQQRMERRMMLEQESQKNLAQVTKIEEQRKKRIEELNSM